MELALPTPKAILFDWDNTLVDTWPVIHEALHYCFTQMGKTPWTLEEVKVRVAHSMRDEFPKLFGERWEEAGELYQQGYLQVHCDRLHPLADALQTVQQIHQAGIFQAVVSNKKGPTLRKEAKELKWEPYFEALVGADDAAHDKPHPAHAELALEGFNESYSPQEIWFVGDSSVDMELAEAAGYTGIFYGEEEKALTLPHPFRARIANHQQFQSLIEPYLRLSLASE